MSTTGNPVNSNKSAAAPPPAAECDSANVKSAAKFAVEQCAVASREFLSEAATAIDNHDDESEFWEVVFEADTAVDALGKLVKLINNEEIFPNYNWYRVVNRSSTEIFGI